MFETPVTVSADFAACGLDSWVLSNGVWILPVQAQSDPPSGHGTWLAVTAIHTATMC